MDAFAVSLSLGMQLPSFSTKNIFIPGVYFGLFQAIMPLLGYFLGIRFSHYIEKYSHWVSFFLLLFIGGKMLIEALKKDKLSSRDFPETPENVSSPLSFKILLPLALATSIDAFAVGVSFSFIKVPVFFSSSIIGIITFLLTTTGIIISKKLGSLFNKKAEFLGGIILIFIGLKMLLEKSL